MTIDTAREREKLAEICRLLAYQAPPRAVRIHDTLASIRGTFLEVSDVIKAQAAEIEKLRATIGALEGAVNWLDALLELVEETSCDPENPEEFDEVMAGAALFGRMARAALTEHEP